MTKEEIVKALLACGRGYCDDCTCYKARWSCATKNFAAADLIEAQAAEIEELKAKVPRWIPVTERLPEPYVDVLLIVNGKVNNITLNNAQEIGSFDKSEGWILGMWPEWEDPKVTHWMPLPEVET